MPEVLDNNIKIFEKYATEYDLWFEKNRYAYESELMALRLVIPKGGKGLEIGVGTGRFASQLDIRVGIDSAKNMLLIAKQRGIEVFNARAEALPFKGQAFDFALMVTLLCFLNDPLIALKEAKRVIKKRGYIIIGMIDKTSKIGRLYETKKGKSRFYSYARFYSVEEILFWLNRLGFRDIIMYQTIFNNLEFINRAEPIKRGFGEGAFIAISARL